MKPWQKLVVVGTFAVIAALYLVPPAKHLAERFYAPWASTAALEKVILSPKAVTLVPAQALQYSVAGKFNDGSTFPIAVDYSATGGTVTGGGVYMAGTTTGTFRVIALAIGGTLADTSTVTITPLSNAPDAVKLMNQLPATGSATVLIDGPRPSGCASDDVFLGIGIVTVGSLLAPSNACLAEVAVFASGNALRLETDVCSWTNNGGDLRKEPLTAPVRLPVVIWVDTVVTGVSPHEDLVNAKNLFYDQKVGVDFDILSSSVVRDRSSDPNAKATIGYGCDSAPGVLTSAYYLEGSLNVYYVHDIHLGALGWNCVDRGFPNQIYISVSGRSSSTLAHEIGHALGLQIPFSGHVNTSDNSIAGMDGSDLMWSYGANRDVITLGQAYRMNAERLSWLNPGLRAGQPVKTCGCNPFHEDPCPMLARNGPGAVASGFKVMPAPVIACSMVLCQFTTSTPTNCAGLMGDLSGSTISLSIGGQTYLRASVKDTGGSDADLSPIWSSANPAIATVGLGNGLVQGLANGCAAVNAWRDGVRATVTVKVGASGAC